MEEYNAIGEILAHYPHLNDDEEKTLQEWLVQSKNYAVFKYLVYKEYITEKLADYYRIKQSLEKNRQKLIHIIDINSNRHNRVWIVQTITLAFTLSSLNHHTWFVFSL